MSEIARDAAVDGAGLNEIFVKTKETKSAWKVMKTMPGVVAELRNNVLRCPSRGCCLPNSIVMFRICEPHTCTPQDYSACHRLPSIFLAFRQSIIINKFFFL